MLHCSRSLNQTTFKCIFAFWSLFCQYRANISQESIEFKYVSFLILIFCGNDDLFILSFPIRSLIVFHVFFASFLKVRIFSEQQFLFYFLLFQKVFYTFCTQLSFEGYCFSNIFPMIFVFSYIDLLRKSMDWFLYDNGLRLEKVKGFRAFTSIFPQGNSHCIVF